MKLNQLQDLSPIVNWTRYFESRFSLLKNSSVSIRKTIDNFLTNPNYTVLISSENYFKNLSDLLKNFQLNTSIYQFSILYLTLENYVIFTKSFIVSIKVLLITSKLSFNFQNSFKNRSSKLPIMVSSSRYSPLS